MDELKSARSTERTSLLPKQPRRRPPSFVLGIAAAASQLGRLKQFLDQLPMDSNMAVVILQPAEPGVSPITGGMLSRHTASRALEALDEALVEGNSVYVVRPQREVIIKDGRLLVIAGDRTSDFAKSLDIFFYSLAQECGERAIGVLLAERNNAPSHGALAIRESGGILLGTEDYTAMPSNRTRTMQTRYAAARRQLSRMVESVSRHVDRVTSDRSTSRDAEALLAIAGTRMADERIWLGRRCLGRYEHSARGITQRGNSALHLRHRRRWEHHVVQFRCRAHAWIPFQRDGRQADSRDPALESGSGSASQRTFGRTRTRGEGFRGICGSCQGRQI